MSILVQVREFYDISLILSYIFVDNFASFCSFLGNPTRGVFERAVAAAEKAKYW